jgi:hypothetical protein
MTVFDPKTATHAECELHIICQFATVALEKGFTISVCDGEDWTLVRSRDLSVIMGALRTTDEDWLAVRDPTLKGKRVGVVQCVYGNEPWVVIADYSDNEAMRELIQPAEIAAKQIEEARS